MSKGERWGMRVSEEERKGGKRGEGREKGKGRESGEGVKNGKREKRR